MPSVIAIVVFFCGCLALQWSLLKGASVVLRVKNRFQERRIGELEEELTTTKASVQTLENDLKMRRSRDRNIAESIDAWERAQRRERAEKPIETKQPVQASRPVNSPVLEVEVSGRRLLAVMRQRSDVAGVERALSAQGIAVQWVGEGGIALGLAVKESCGPAPFSGVIVDAEIDGVEGLQLVRTLRKMPAFAEVPIVMVAHSPSAVWLSAARRAGATAWLQKPLVRWQLLGILLGAWVDGAVRWQEAPVAPSSAPPAAQGGQRSQNRS